MAIKGSIIKIAGPAVIARGKGGKGPGRVLSEKELVTWLGPLNAFHPQIRPPFAPSVATVVPARSRSRISGARSFAIPPRSAVAPHASTGTPAGRA